MNRLENRLSRLEGDEWGGEMNMVIKWADGTVIVRIVNGVWMAGKESHGNQTSGTHLEAGEFTRSHRPD